MIFFSLLSSDFLGQYDKENIFVNFDDPMSVIQMDNKLKIKAATSIHFNKIKSEKDLAMAFQKLKDFENIERIIISNYEGKKMPSEISDMMFINAITLVNCDNLNWRHTFKQMGNLPVLEELNLGNNNIQVIPKEIGMLSRLLKLDISFNLNLDLETSLVSLKGCSNLQKLALPVNQISEIPESIGELRQLRELNLTDNNLTDLPIGISNMDSLEALYVAKNIIVDPVKTYSKLDKLNIKVLSIDQVSEEDLKIIQEMFPQTAINQKKTKDIEELMKHMDSSTDKETPKELHASSVRQVEQSVQYDAEIYSLAYTRYGATFDALQKPKSSIDSTLFDERFLDTNYYNIFRRQPGLDYDYFQLKLIRNKVKDQVWLNFEMNKYLYTYFPEQKSFANMIWTVVGVNSDKSAIKSEYIKDVRYTDFRLFYHADKKQFTLRLKTQDHFKTLTVVPRYNNGKSSLSLVQPTYEKRYLRYLELLDERRQKFNSDQYSENVAYRSKVNRLHGKSWKEFKDKYFSKQEQEMSEEEWLIYYDKVLANESKALENTLINSSFIERYLVVKGVKSLKYLEDLKKHQNTQIGRFKFKDETGDDVVITSLIVINKTLEEFKVYEGSKGLMEFYLFLRQSDEYCIVANYRNGDVGTLDHLNFDEIIFMQEAANTIELKRFVKEYSTIGDLSNFLNL